MKPVRFYRYRDSRERHQGDGRLLTPKSEYPDAGLVMTKTGRERDRLL